MHLAISVSVTFYVALGVKASYSNPLIENIGLNEKNQYKVFLIERMNILQIQGGAACLRSTPLCIYVARVYYWIVH